MAFFDGAQSWSRVERIIARVRSGRGKKPDTRFVVTNLSKRNARRLYEDVYCRRGQAENHIKSLEDPSGGGSHVLLKGRQPTSFGYSCMPAPIG